jgi:hypothetical protein
MITAEAAVLIAFSAANACRLVAYLPQIVALLKETNGAAAVSGATWILFLISNGVTAVYASVVCADIALTAIFSANSLCCAAIVLLIFRKRSQSRRPVRRRLLPAR